MRNIIHELSIMTQGYEGPVAKAEPPEDSQNSVNQNIAWWGRNLV